MFRTAAKGSINRYTIDRGSSPVISRGYLSSLVCANKSTSINRFDDSMVDYLSAEVLLQQAFSIRSDVSFGGTRASSAAVNARPCWRFNSPCFVFPVLVRLKRYFLHGGLIRRGAHGIGAPGSLSVGIVLSNKLQQLLPTYYASLASAPM